MGGSKVNIRLRTKYKLLMLSVVSMAMFLSLILSFFTLKRVVVDDFIAKNQSKIDVCTQGAKSYSEMIEHICLNVQTNDVIKDALLQEEYTTGVTWIIDSIMQTNAAVYGVTILSDKGQKYESTPKPVPISIEDISTIEGAVNNNMGNNIRWLVRSVNDYTDRTDVSKLAWGCILSCYGAITNNNEIIGYIVIDVSLNNIYNFYKFEEENHLDISGFAIMTNEGVIYSDSEKTKHILDVNNEQSYYLRNNTMIIKDPIDNMNVNIFVLKDISGILRTFYMYYGFVLILCLIMFIVMYKIINVITNSIIEPINELNNKIKDFPSTYK